MISDNDSLTTEELMRRARELSRLGNSPKQIRLVLSRLNVTAEQMDVALATIESKSRQKQKSDSTFIGALVSAAVVFFTVMLIGAYWLGSRQGSATTVPHAGATNRPGPTNTPSLQALAQTLAPNIPWQLLPSLIPADMPANFMLATPVVVIKATSVPGSARAGCPILETEAAKLFGGEASHWAYDRQTNGWTLTSLTQAVALNVPEGFTAGYLVLVNGPEMRSVDGPATLAGVNFVALSCP